MEERRNVHRSRTCLGGRVVFNNHCSTMDCVIRNVSQNGAKIEFSDMAFIPSEFDILICKKGESRRARVVWRQQKAAGVQFLQSV